MSAQIDSQTSDNLDKVVAEWLRQDKDEETRSYIQDLVNRNDQKELRNLLCSSKSIASYLCSCSVENSIFI